MRQRIQSEYFATSSVAPALSLAGWCIFALFLLAQAKAGPALIWNDSETYARIAARPVWSMAFWSGSRPPLIPLAIKAFGSQSGFLLAQAVIGAISWGLLAWTVGRQVRPGWMRVLATWTILGFATTLPVNLWNRSVLSESISLSLLALIVAALIWTHREMTFPRIAVTTFVCLCFALARDAQIWTVAMLFALSGAYCVRSITRDRRLAIRSGLLATCLLLVVVSTAWASLESKRTLSNVADVLYIRIFPFPNRVAWFAGHGMPEQARIDQLARSVPSNPNVAKLVVPPTDGSSFAELNGWIAQHGEQTYLEWLVTHPWYFLTDPLDRPEQSYNFGQGNLEIYMATTNPVESPLTYAMWPPLLWLVLAWALAILLGIATDSWRDRNWQTAAVLTVMGVLAMLIAWHGDGQEVTRHTVEGFALLRLAVWILLILGIFDSANGSPRFVSWISKPAVVQSSSLS